VRCLVVACTLIACGGKGASDATPAPDGAAGGVPSGPDVVPPTFAGVASVRVTSVPNRILVVWDPARDDRTPPERIVYEVVAATAATWGQKLGPADATTATTAPGETRAELLLPDSQIGRDHWVRVRARDAAGNVDANDVTRAVTLRYPRQAIYPPMGGAVLSTALDLEDGRVLIAGFHGAIGQVEPGREPRVFPPVTSADFVGLARFQGRVVALTHTGQLLVVDPDRAQATPFDPPVPAEGAGGFRAVAADGADLYVAQAPANIFRLREGRWTRAPVEARCGEIRALRAAPAMGTCVNGVIEPDAGGTWRVSAAHEGLIDAARIGKLGFFAIDENGLALRSAGRELIRVPRDRPIRPGAVVWADASGEAGALEAHQAMVFTDEVLAPLSGRKPRDVRTGPGFTVRAAVPLGRGRLVAVGEGVAIFEDGRWLRLDRHPLPTILGGDGGPGVALVLESSPAGLRLVELDADGAARPLPAPKGARGFGAACVQENAGYLVADSRGTVYHYQAGRWTPRPIPGARGASAVRAMACLRDEAYLVGPRGFVAHFNGGEWRRVSTSGPDLSDVAMPAPGRAVAVGKGGAILVIKDDEVTRRISTGSVELRSCAAIGERLFVATGAGTVEEFDLEGDPITIHEPKSHDPNEPEVDLDTLASRPDGTLYIGGAVEVWVLAGGNASTMATWLGKLSGILPTADGNLLMLTRNAVVRLNLR
jgi:hypothetical protein